MYFWCTIFNRMKRSKNADSQFNWHLIRRQTMHCAVHVKSVSRWSNRFTFALASISLIRRLIGIVNSVQDEIRIYLTAWNSNARFLFSFFRLFSRIKSKTWGWSTNYLEFQTIPHKLFKCRHCGKLLLFERKCTQDVWSGSNK